MFGKNQIDEVSSDLLNVNFPLTGAYPKQQNYIRTAKYTIFSVIPLNLFSQFKRVYNIYFLVAACTAISKFTALSPVTQITPLITVLFVSLLKDAYEDYQRVKQDRAANNTPANVFRDGKLMPILAQDIAPGDLIYYEKGEKFSVDAIVVSTSLEDGSCFVDTAELDGETNLKRRIGCSELLHLKNTDTLPLFNGQIQCEFPNENLLNFEGRLDLPETFALNVKDSSHVLPLSINHLLLRGAVLRNTDHCWGLVLYTGSDTKIMKNLKQAKMKVSSLEKSLNKFTFYAFLFNMVLLVSSILLELQFFYQNIADTARIGKQFNEYLGTSESDVSLQILGDIFSFFAIYTYVIPISLFVSLEITRLAQGLFMKWDVKMRYDRPLPDGTKMKQRMRPNNTNLNEELGMVEYIFSDKTGTLTQNEMVLAKFFVNKTTFDEMANPGAMWKSLESGILPNGEPMDPLTREFAILLQRTLALAHDVLPARGPKGGFIYESASPDETALLNAAAANKFALISRTKAATVIETNLKFSDDQGVARGELDAGVGGAVYSSTTLIESYQPLTILEFSSDRKRMSMICRTPMGKIHLYCKGADNIIINRLHSSPEFNPPAVIKSAELALKNFSEEGLRTLMLAWKELTEDEYTTFRRLYDEAERSISGRDENIARACETIEVGLRYLGCTAIEDRLQDQVPETIDYLLKADIKIWLLTGDKQETAINIGLSSKLLNNNFHIHILNGKSLEEIDSKIASMLKTILSEPSKTHALVINGESLGYIFSGPTETQLAFLDAGTRCRSVICCRVTPLQKALVVRLVKKNVKCVTLSIGDGANDVSMIQAANIGVGIMGREGTQAVRASDYAFAEFRFLKRLLAVHGRYSYMRIATIIMFSFYKNITLIFVQWMFGFVSQWSGQIVYEEIFMTAYNMIFTSISPIVLSVFDRDVNDDKIELYPQLYKEVKGNSYWNFWTVLGWMMTALWHATAIFGTIYFVSTDGCISSSGRTTGYWVQTSFFGTPVLLTVLLKFALATKTFVWIHWAAFFISISLNVTSQMIVEYLGFSEIGNGVLSYVSFTYYATCFLLPIMANLPDFFFMFYKRTFHPHDADIICEEQSVLKGRRYSNTSFQLLYVDDDPRRRLNPSSA